LGYIIDENKARKNFYRDNYRMVVTGFVILLGLIIFLVLAKYLGVGGCVSI